MTPAERARDFTTAFCVAKGQLVGFDQNIWLEVNAARLIRSAEQAAYERAAKLAEYFRHPNPFPTLHGAIAQAIRDLAKEGG